MGILKSLGIGFASVIGIVLVYLVGVIFLPFREIEKISIKGKADTVDYVVPESRKPVSFTADGHKIDAWLYLPVNMPEPVGCIIMSNGFGGIKGRILENYALRYLEAGYASIVYDFRHFGESEGEPRQLFSSTKQYEDLYAAIDFAKQVEGINPDKIVLWGTSASGGYGLVIAAKDKKIGAIIGQCPALDRHADSELALKRNGVLYYLRLFMHAQRDKGRSRFGLSPHKIPIAGREGELAFFTASGVLEGYEELSDSTFENEICARALLETDRQNPIDFVQEVNCPILLQACEYDNLVSKEPVLKVNEILGDQVVVKEYPCGHFDIYVDDFFEQAIDDQIEFLKENLKD